MKTITVTATIKTTHPELYTSLAIREALETLLKSAWTFGPHYEAEATIPHVGVTIDPPFTPKPKGTSAYDVRSPQELCEPRYER